MLILFLYLWIEKYIKIIDNQLTVKISLNNILTFKTINNVIILIIK